MQFLRGPSPRGVTPTARLTAQGLHPLGTGEAVIPDATRYRWRARQRARHQHPSADPVRADLRAFRGGWKHRADVDPGNPHTGGRLRLVGFRMSAQLLPLDGEGEGGTITFEQADIDVDAASLLKQTQQFPPRYQCRLVVDPCTMTIDSRAVSRWF